MSGFLRYICSALAWHCPVIGAKRFVAGHTMGEALWKAHLLEEQGFAVTLNILGEYVERAFTANVFTDEYIELARQLWTQHFHNPAIAVKLSQIGLDVSEYMCRMNLLRILFACERFGVLVEIDRESSFYSDTAQDIYDKAFALFGSRVRLCVQMNQEKSLREAVRHIERHQPMRVCKGAYEPELASKEIIKRMHFVTDLSRALGDDLENRQIAFATHDIAFLDNLRSSGPYPWLELQMLRGIERGAAKQLIKDGFKVRIYVPYGQNWLNYGKRRWRSIAGIWWRNFKYRACCWQLIRPR